jgi:hypothetical protein
VREAGHFSLIEKRAAEIVGELVRAGQA